MKTLKIFPLFLALLVLGSCYPTKNLPKSKSLNSFPYGSNFQWKNSDDKLLEGELLAVEDGFLYVLPYLDSEYSNEFYKLEYKSLKKFRLVYVKPKSYWWTIPVSMVVSIGQGLLSIFTLPINLISTGFIISSTYKNASFSESQITYDELREFARYPQGMPKDIDITTLKKERRPVMGF